MLGFAEREASEAMNDCQQAIEALSDKQPVQSAFDEYFGPYSAEKHLIGLQMAQLRALEQARDILAWNPLKRWHRSGTVAEARSRLRGWLFERRCRG